MRPPTKQMDWRLVSQPDNAKECLQKFKIILRHVDKLVGVDDLYHIYASRILGTDEIAFHGTPGRLGRRCEVSSIKDLNFLSMPGDINICFPSL